MERLDQIKQMLSEDAKNSFLNFALAKEYESQSNYTMAIEHYEFIRQNDPSYVGTFYHLAKLYIANEDFSNAKFIIEEGITIAKSLKDFHAESELKNLLMNLMVDL
ncbi:MAG: hypothetical protein IPP01_10310 [Saprospiraceae bacterium]|nr:hypothetical protein [Saprospiraceae bacterium]